MLSSPFKAQRTFIEGALALLLLSLFCISLAFAEHEEVHSSPSKEHLDLVLVLDASGTMRITDPLRLRDEGAKLLTQFLKSGDRLAIVEFSRDAKILRPLSEFKKENAAEIEKTISSVGDSGEYTDLLAPVKVAASILDESVRPEANQVVILFSDGKMDPDPKMGAASDFTELLVGKYVPELRAKDVKIYTLSLSELADKDLLSQVAVATNGVHWFAPTADKIQESFTDLFLEVKKPQIAPLTSRGFRIDPDIEEATFYIARENEDPVTLMSPAGTEYNSDRQHEEVKWHKGTRFDVVTIPHPEVGQWQVVGLPKNEGFATLLTNLKLVTEWPSYLTAGTPAVLEARLYEAKKPVVLPEMSGTTRYAFQITPTDRVSEPIMRELLVDDGTHGDKVANDGVFSRAVTIEEPGEYKMRLVASGPTFERNQQVSFRVKPPLLKIFIVPAEESMAGQGHAAPVAGHHGEAGAGGGHGDGHGEEHGDEHGEHGEESHEPAEGLKYIQVKLSPETEGLKNIDVKLVAVDKEKHRFTLPLKEIDGVYEVSTAVLPHEGEYVLTATLSAVGKGKKTTRADSEEVTYMHAHQESTGKVVEMHVDTLVGPKKEPIWLYALIMTIINCGAGAATLMMVKRSSGPTESVAIDTFESVEPIEQALNALEAKLKIKDVDVNDPVFAEGADKGAAPAEEAPAEAAPPSEEPPAAEETDSEAEATEEPPAEEEAPEEEEEA